ncbi:hypothetical protein N0V83_002467 [Neocucurbitaria cava]|uniref:SH3 domain-containing protein n=1 Tax=Neocucurbitaria cava TaxID=798079 RepID=A0A9W9CPZ2_9PLEO|nr:hypothetical protein N0V83_002467 [Neocucurbitaria cava]
MLRFRDQEDNDDDDNNDNVETVISVEIVTAENTNTGRVVWVTQTAEQQKTLVPPAVRTRPSSTDDEDDQESTTTAKATASKKASSTQNTDAEETGSATLKQASTLMVATKAPTPGSGSAVAGLASATAAITSVSATASAEATEGGMSGGAKAGLALGILVAVGALLVGILLVYRRKKKQMVAEKQNEKIDLYDAPPPPPPQVQTAAASAPSIRTQRTMSTAPRLSLRPVTQFDPTFNEQRKSGGNLLSVAAAGGAAASHNRDQSSERPTSAWERPGATNAPAANPFNDPENRSGPPSANPFGNNAALDHHQASIPDSPPNASPMHSTKPSGDFANPAPAIAAADIDPVAMAGAMSSIPPPTNELPLPPAIAANTASVPPSPAWTEDFPASPGPAPTGALPIAGGAMAAGSRSQSPAPGPNNVHRVQLDFKPSMQDELDLQAGQLVRMLHEYDDGWVSSSRAFN